MKKKLQLILSTIFMVLASLTAYGQQVGDTFDAANGIKHRITALGLPNTVMIIEYKGTATSINIPDTVTYQSSDFKVTGIRTSAFQAKDLISVTIPNGVTSIGGFAFAENDLTSVTIPNGVGIIGAGAFQANDLTKVTIPGSVTDIGGAAFTNNPDLVTVVLERTNPPSIEESTFENRNRIDVVIPKDALNGYKTAWSSFNFKSITGEKGVGETFTVNGITHEITALGSPNPNTVTITGYQNQNTTTSVNIPKTITYQGNGFEVTRIGDGAFQNNQLTSVIIPESVETIDDWAFANNPGLTTVGSERTEPPSIEENTFEDRNQMFQRIPKPLMKTNGAQILNPSWKKETLMRPLQLMVLVIK